MNDSFFSDAGGIAACSRWLRSGSDDTTGRRRAQDFAPRPESQQLLFSHANLVVSRRLTTG